MMIHILSVHEILLLVSHRPKYSCIFSNSNYEATKFGPRNLKNWTILGHFFGNNIYEAIRSRPKLIQSKLFLWESILS